MKRDKQSLLKDIKRNSTMCPMCGGISLFNGSFFKCSVCDHEDIIWQEFWDKKSLDNNDFNANGRGSMDIVGFLYSLGEIEKHLNLDKNDVVLDVGCGTGLISLFMSSLVKKVIGIDLSLGMVKRARENCKFKDNTKFFRKDIRNFSLEKVDKIIGYSILQYLENIEDLETAFKSIYDVLKNNGKVLFCDNPDGSKKEEFIGEVSSILKGNHRDKTINDINNSNWYSSKECIRVAKKVGFKVRVFPTHKRIWEGFYVPNMYKFMYNILLTKESR